MTSQELINKLESIGDKNRRVIAIDEKSNVLFYTLKYVEDDDEDGITIYLNPHYESEY